MTDEEIKDKLSKGYSIQVMNTWVFTGKNMVCAEPGCCEYYYDTFEKVIEIIRVLSHSPRDIKVL